MIVGVNIIKAKMHAPSGMTIFSTDPSESGFQEKPGENFINAMPVDQTHNLFSEQLLSAKLDGWRLVAKYDLIAVDQEGTLQIFDWKTSRRPAPRERMASRLLRTTRAPAE